MKKCGLMLGLLLAGIVGGCVYSSSPGQIVFQRFDDDEHGRKAIFEIVNRGDKPLYFYGYGTDSPLYSLKVRTTAGRWEPQFMGWCGTGAGHHALAAGGRSQFAVYESHAHPGLPFRVGIHFSPGAPTFGSMTTGHWIEKLRDLLGLGDPNITWSDTTR